MSPMSIIRSSITRAELQKLAQERFGDMVKAVVDIKRGIMAVAGELHADEEQLLLEDGSKQENLWGINLYPDTEGDGWIEFDSMINIRPAQGNRSMEITDENTRRAVRKIVALAVPFLGL